MKKLLTQKSYVIYITISVLLWLAVMILTEISGGAYNVKNGELFAVATVASHIVTTISFVPVIPFIWYFVFVNSLENKKYGWAVFNALSIAGVCYLWFCFMANHIVYVCGGV